MLRKNFLLLCAFFLCFAGEGTAQTKISVFAGKPGPEIQPTMWGIFFEDINFAADGGLYAELVKNRSFSFPDPFTGWKVPFRDSVLLINETSGRKAHRFLRLRSLSGDKETFIQNEGFRGMGIHAGEDYRLTVSSRIAEGRKLSLNAELIGENGNILGTTHIDGLSGKWDTHEVVFRANADDEKASLKIILGENGTVDIDFVSLFPVHTFKNRPNGMRNDLAGLLAGLHPGFVRFPGGCIVEGHHLDLRYQWKKTIGDIRDRQTIINRWNTEFMYRHTPDYFQSFGLGFYEYFLFAEDIGAEPLPILNCGMACQYNTGELVPMEEMGPYIQDALDLIEFANGDTSTKWGKMREEMGHPEPFHLKYLGIGNEQWGSQYLERYDLIAGKVHAKYPDVKLVSGSGPSSDGARFDYLWKELPDRQVSLVDEHYYKDPDWFFNNARRYDTYPRNGLKVFAGEYASHTKVKNDDPTSNNNWLSALSEAAFMTGLERNADVVNMASYAPLFAHVRAWQWRPDLIWFDNLRAVATPDYYVQKLYSTHRGTNIVSVLADGEVIAGQDSLYSSASVDKPGHRLYLKLVNASSKAADIDIVVKDCRLTGKEVTVTELFSDRLMTYNTLDDPDRIVPSERKLPVKGNKLTLKMRPRSFVVIDAQYK